MGIILSMPDADNGWVNEDLADAALSMPPEFSARLIGKVEKWAQSAYSPLLSKKLGSLMAHLARGGQVDEALGLARALLEVLPDARMESESEMEGIQPGPPAPTTRIETWDYEQILKNDFPDVVKAAGVGALALLCDLIQAAIQFSRRGGDDEVVDDYSYISGAGLSRIMPRTGSTRSRMFWYLVFVMRPSS